MTVSHCSCDTPAHSLTWRAGDGSLFYVQAAGPHLRDVTAVKWRGVDICPDCFFEQLDDDEMFALEARLAGDSRDL